MGNKPTQANQNHSHSHNQRGSNIPTQPSVPKMPKTKPPAKTPNKK